MLKRIPRSLVIGLIGVTMLGTPAMAAKPVGGGTASTVGNDISYPQCGRTLPTGQAFGVVGVNGGLANDLNPCFGSELTWAQRSSGVVASQAPEQLYVNTGNPGDVTPTVADWPTGPVTNTYGTCNGENSAACAYEYGVERANQDVAWINAVNNGAITTAGQMIWLDVETSNSWSSQYLTNNTAVLEAMTTTLTSAGATVGIYSTSSQWATIVGTTVGSASPLNGLANWRAGARSQSAAKSNCSLPPLTTGGKVTLTQYVSGNLDYDVSCR